MVAGRGELHPHSDIDILILRLNERGKRHPWAIEQFLPLLWECNLKVGSSVCANAECAVKEAADLTIITTMIESRLLSESRTFCKDEGSYSARTVSSLVSVWRFKNGDCRYAFLQVC